MIKNKRLTKIIAMIIALTCSLTLVSCNQKSNEQKETKRTFVDSLNRKIDVPNKISKYVVSGPLALIPSFAVNPDGLLALPTKWDESANKYLDSKYLDLPVVGQLYGGKSEMDKETLMNLNPDVIIDIGEKKGDVSKDLDDLTNQTGIATVFIEASLSEPRKCFDKLGELFGMEDKANTISEYCENINNLTRDTMDKVGNNKKNVLYCLGDNGCNVIAKGSYHSELIDMIANNIAVVDNPTSKGLGNEVDFEQILNWNPEYIIFENSSIGDSVKQNEMWQLLDAIKNDNYTTAPNLIYNYMGFPPSFQRYLGMLYLVPKLYPDYVNYDYNKKIREFYKLFLHCDVK